VKEGVRAAPGRRSVFNVARRQRARHAVGCGLPSTV